MKTGLNRFANNLKDKKVSTALIYFSGHGFQLAGENYLVPLGLSERRSITDQSLSISSVNNALSRNSNPKILIIDACRSSILEQGTVSISTGLNSQAAAPNTLIAYATAPGKVAFDGPAGSNSPYASSLAQAIDSHSDIQNIFQSTRIQTMRLTNGEQIPWESSSLIEKISFTSLNQTLQLIMKKN